MLNEPFQILDNIPLIMCFTSFETYQSRVLEIVTQKARPHWRPTANPTRFFSTPCPLWFTVCLPSHFHTDLPQLLNLCICIPSCPLAQKLSCACVCRGGRKKWEMKSEEGVWVIACSRDTWSLSGEEIPGAEGRGGGGMSSISAQASKEKRAPHFDLHGQFSRRSTKITIHVGYCNFSLEPCL